MLTSCCSCSPRSCSESSGGHHDFVSNTASPVSRTWRWYLVIIHQVACVLGYYHYKYIMLQHFSKLSLSIIAGILRYYNIHHVARILGFYHYPLCCTYSSILSLSIMLQVFFDIVIIHHVANILGFYHHPLCCTYSWIL